VCLSHQVLAAQLGLPVVPLPAPHQGTQREVDLFGRSVRVGFYNTFTAVAAEGLTPGRRDITLSTDPGTGEVLGIRGPGVASVQCHLESLLSPDGAAVLTDLVAGLLPPPAGTAPSRGSSRACEG
jgi:phenazine biosynthesis protein phzE